ncbi:MAG TPA: GspE/PulE family protein [Lacunisphaera sp.]
MFDGHHSLIFDFLTSRRSIEPAALLAAFHEHESTDKAFTSVIVDTGLMEKAALLGALAEYLGCDYADKLPSGVSPELVGLLPPDCARSFEVMPVAIDGSTAVLLTVDPFNSHLAGDLAFVLGQPVRLAMADPDEIRTLIRQYYGAGKPPADEPPIQSPDAGAEKAGEAALTEADIEKMAGQTPIIRFVNLVLAQAIRDGASDIHFEPFAQEFKIRCRIDGTLCEMTPPARTLALPITSRLKVMASLNIAERRLPQDGRIALKIGGRAVDLRVSTLPTQFGESVVLRILDQSSAKLKLREIGLPATIQNKIESVIQRPNGIFIVTGPTGCGKTTTLYSCLKQLNTVDTKLLSVEDPVEYELDGVMQVPVNFAAGLTFGRALRAFLRQDPDIVMVGEIRDFETAQIAIQAALTGHLVLTTLHTNDATGAITRLTDMGIEPFLLASTVEAVLAQRLLRRICPACRIEFEPAVPLLGHLGLNRTSMQGRSFYRGTGCVECQQTGYKGRLGLFEYLEVTESFREKVAEGASLMDLRARAMADGMTSLRDAGMRALFSGDTTIEEVIRYT